jgi:hypothetical protein
MSRDHVGRGLAPAETWRKYPHQGMALQKRIFAWKEEITCNYPLFLVLCPGMPDFGETIWKEKHFTRTSGS